MNATTVYLEEDEFWPWVSFGVRYYANRYTEAVKVDRETAQRWERGLAAALALQEEMAGALEAARNARLAGPS